MARLLLNWAFLAVLMCVLAPAAAAQPVSYISENLESNFYANGTLSSPIEARGYVEVGIPDSADVLQYVRLYLSGTANTNMVSNEVYRATAASPTPSSRTVMYVNTTHDSQDFSYNITSYASVPVIYLNLTYTNEDGGSDIHSGGANTLSFTMRITSSQNIASANLSFGVALDKMGGNDSMRLSSPSSSAGSASVIDSDSDGIEDTVIWNGPVTAPGVTVVIFRGTTTPGASFDESDLYVDVGEGRQTMASSNVGSTFTGITFTDRFTRGPVREGVEMIMGTPNIVRGYIKNIASNLSYRTHSWNIYRVGDFSLPLISGSPETTLTSGQQYYTDWYNTGITGKALYFATAFDWEVVWGPSIYSANTVGYMDLPTLYEIDITPYNDVIGITSNTVSGRSVGINESVKHTGHAGLYCDEFEAAIVPPSGWTVNPSSLRVYYSNESSGGAVHDITGFTSTGTQGSNLTVSAASLSAAIGHAMGENDDVILSYTMSGPSISSTQLYTFGTRFTFRTLSLTPVTETFEKQISIPGVSEPPQPPGPGGGTGGGGGGGAGGQELFADFVKEKADIQLLDTNTVTLTVKDGVMDTGDKGITDVSGIIYVPDKAVLNPQDISVIVYRKNGRVEHMLIGSGIKVTESRIEKIGGANYKSYILEKITDSNPLTKDTLDLYNGDSIEISYKSIMPFGTHNLLTRIFGYNYYENKIISDDVYAPIRIASRVAGIGSLEIEESRFVQGVAFVDQPVKWIKTVQVYNPNPISIEYTFSASVFGDTMNAYLVGGGKKPLRLVKNGTAFATWNDEMKRGERKTYFIEAVTPPVLEKMETIEVMEHNSELAKFVINATLENTASEDYANVSFVVKISGEKIQSVTDGGVPVGRVINRSGTESIIQLPIFEAGKNKVITVTYNEIPPVMVIKPDRFTYTIRNAPVNLTLILVLSQPLDAATIEVEVIGPKPGMETVYTESTDFNTLGIDEVIKNYYTLTLPYSPPGEYTVVAKLRVGSLTMLSAQEKFYVIAPEEPPQGISPLFVVIMAVAIVALLILRKFRGEKYTQTVEALKSKIKKIK